MTKKTMIRNVLLLFISVGLTSAFARELSENQRGFSIKFPDGADWTEVTREEQSANSVLWSSTNRRMGLMLSILVLPTPQGISDTRFKENALAWQKGFARQFTTVEPGQFGRLAERDAYNLKTAIVRQESQVLFTTWLVQKDPYVYQISIAAAKAEDRDGNVARSFLASLKIHRIGNLE